MKQTTTQPCLNLAWIQGDLLCVGRRDGECIYVNDRIYDSVMKEHLANLGIIRQTMTQYIRPAEEAWQHQCELETLLRARGVPLHEIKKHLANLGITWQTRTQYIQPAEEAWQHQCELETLLRSNLDFWKQIPGVRVAQIGEKPPLWCVPSTLAGKGVRNGS